jgi:hypothetical protein
MSSTNQTAQLNYINNFSAPLKQEVVTKTKKVSKARNNRN